VPTRTLPGPPGSKISRLVIKNSTDHSESPPGWSPIKSVGVSRPVRGAWSWCPRRGGAPDGDRQPMAGRNGRAGNGGPSNGASRGNGHLGIGSSMRPAETRGGSRCEPDRKRWLGRSGYRVLISPAGRTGRFARRRHSVVCAVKNTRRNLPIWISSRLAGTAESTG